MPVEPAVFLSATGLTWSTYAGASISDLRDALGQSTPRVTAIAASGGEHAEHGASSGEGEPRGEDVGLDAGLKAAQLPAFAGLLATGEGQRRHRAGGSAMGTPGD